MADLDAAQDGQATGSDQHVPVQANSSLVQGSSSVHLGLGEGGTEPDEAQVFPEISEGRPLHSGKHLESGQTGPHRRLVVTCKHHPPKDGKPCKELKAVRRASRARQSLRGQRALCDVGAMIFCW